MKKKKGLGLIGRIKDFLNFRNSQSDTFVQPGVWKFQVHRKGVLIAEEEVHNLITTEGIHFVLDQAFRNQAGASAWYLGLVDNASFLAFNNADTMASHAGWIEVTAYDEATRPTWTTIAASGRAITNTSVAVFTINATKTVHGFFLASNSTKGGTTGKLWAAGSLTANRSVVDDDVISLVYTINGPA